MTTISKTGRRTLRGSTALHALALIGAGVGALACAAPVAAQDYNQVNATGRVQSTEGQPIAGARVTVTSNAQGDKRSVTTDNDGAFRVPALQQGSYTFSIEADGFDTFVDDAVSLTQAGAANQFRLAPTGSSAGGDIVVTAGRQQVVDFDRNTTGTVINLGDLATRVPVARDIASVIQLSPGTTQGDAAFGNLANISGSSVAENAFFLNGLNITNFRTGLGAVAVPFEFYQSVEIKNGGLAAEYGRLTGGLVNATTKSGSNDFHGGIRFNWEPDDLRSDAPNTLTQDNDAREIERKDFIAQLSGPIIKDHLFFYALYNSREVESTQAITALSAGTPANPTLLGTQYLTDRSTSPFWAAKVDAVIVDGQRLEFTIFDTSNVTRRNIFGTAASGRRYNPVTNDPGNYAGTTVFRSGGLNYVGRYTGTFTPWLTLSAAYGRNKDRDNTDASSTFSAVTDTRGGRNQAIGNPVSNAILNQDEREFYRGDADIYVNLLGSHHFRGGYDRETLTTSIVSQSYGLGQITLVDGSAGDQFGITTGQYAQVRFFRNGGTFKSTNEAFYLQDNWSLFANRLALQLGIRNDRFINRNIDGQAFYRSGNQWGPRLGFVLDPIGDGSTKVYGSFSRYFFPVAASTNNRLGGAELDQNQFFRFNGLDANNVPILGQQIVPTGGVPCPEGTGTCTVTSDGQAGDASTLIDANLKSQSLDEYIVGFERRFGRRLRVNVFGTYRDLNQSLEDASINGAVRRFCAENNLTGLTGGRSCAQIYGAATNNQYILLNPGSGASFTLDRLINGETTPRTITLTPAQLDLRQARRNYRSMTLQVVREYDGVWSGEFSYTFSKLVGNTEGGVRSDGTGQADTGATVDFDFPGLGDGTFGYLPNDRRHNFKAFGSYQLFDWLNLGTNVSVTSPKRFGCLGAVPSSRDPGPGAAGYGAQGTYCNLAADGTVRTTPATAGEVLPPRQVVQRGTGNRGDWQAILNVDASIKVPSDLFDATVRVSVFNVLNRSGVTDLDESGTTGTGLPRINYGTITGYQAPRSARIQLDMSF